MSSQPAEESTQLYVKVANYPGLYRHAKTDRYYAVKKFQGKRRERSLDTTDRKIAERRFKEWVADMGKVDSEVEKTTLAQLVLRFHALNKGSAPRTQRGARCVLGMFMRWWPYGSDYQVRNVRTSQLDEWLAIQEPKMQNATYNHYAGVLKRLFDIAVRDRIIADSPCNRLNTPWKRPLKTVRHIPTIEQFEAIVKSVRSQQANFPDDSANFLAFLGLAGLGQGEAAALTWGDVDWGKNRLNIRRRKTKALFYVPIYPHLRPLLEQLKSDNAFESPNKLVFKIKDGKSALKTACARLGFRSFSQRNLRQCLIMRLWKSGVDKKLIAKWQGHRDGGQLIMDTYTEVFGDDDDQYEEQQIAKISMSGKSNEGVCL